MAEQEDQPRPSANDLIAAALASTRAAVTFTCRAVLIDQDQAAIGAMRLLGDAAQILHDRFPDARPDQHYPPERLAPLLAECLPLPPPAKPSAASTSER